jgi:hypothetical protein
VTASIAWSSAVSAATLLSSTGAVVLAALIELSWNTRLTASAVVNNAPAPKLKGFLAIFFTPFTN